MGIVFAASFQSVKKIYCACQHSGASHCVTTIIDGGFVCITVYWINSKQKPINFIGNKFSEISKSNEFRSNDEKSDNQSTTAGFQAAQRFSSNRRTRENQNYPIFECITRGGGTHR